MVKNPFKKKKKKNPFEASMPLDKPEAKMVEARYEGKPFLVAFGKAKKRDVKGAGGVGTEGVKGEYQSQKDLEWQVLYNLENLPKGFMPEEKLKDWMAGTISVASAGNATVFNPDTKFIEAPEEKLEKAKTFTVDAILTGRFFGLESTISSKVSKKTQEKKKQDNARQSSNKTNN